jgi:hypothetical protein
MTQKTASPATAFPESSLEVLPYPVLPGLSSAQDGVVSVCGRDPPGGVRQAMPSLTPIEEEGILLCALRGALRLRPFRQIDFKSCQDLTNKHIVSHQGRDLQGLRIYTVLYTPVAVSCIIPSQRNRHLRRRNKR